MSEEEKWYSELEENYEEIVEMLSNGNFLQLNGKAINLTELNEYINAQQEEIERLNNIINSIDTKLIEMGVDDEMLDTCEMYDVNGIELRKMLKELKGIDKE